MMRVSISTLKAKLSEYLSAVRAGEEIVVTDRGRPVARIVRVGGEGELESRMEELVRSGLVRPPRAEPPADPAGLAVDAPRNAGDQVLSALLEERRSGR